jgi:hypothetical protein
VKLADWACNTSLYVFVKDAESFRLSVDGEFPLAPDSPDEGVLEEKNCFKLKKSSCVL